MHTLTRWYLCSKGNEGIMRDNQLDFLFLDYTDGRASNGIRIAISNVTSDVWSNIVLVKNFKTISGRKLRITMTLNCRAIHDAIMEWINLKQSSMVFLWLSSISVKLSRNKLKSRIRIVSVNRIAVPPARQEADWSAARIISRLCKGEIIARHVVNSTS